MYQYLVKIRYILLAIILVSIVIAASSIVLYSGTTTPLYVVESKSMEHSEYWTYGTINTGDIVFAKNIHDSKGNVITYVQGRESGFKNYGDYGNVILFKDNQGRILIHRAMFYLTWEGSMPVVSDSGNQSWITVKGDSIILSDVGQEHRNLIVYLSNFVGISGFITVGDYNLANSHVYNSTANAYLASDQNAFGFGPVKPSSVVGTAFGNVPWFGLIKLNLLKLGGGWPESNQVPQNAYLYLSLSTVLLLVVIFLPYNRIIDGVKGRNEKRRRSSD